MIPNVVGKSLEDAQLRMKRLKLRTKVRWKPGKPGLVLEQRPRAGLAAAPGVQVELVVARPSEAVAAG